MKIKSVCAYFVSTNFLEKVHISTTYDGQWGCLLLFVQRIQNDLGSFFFANLWFPLESISFLDHITGAR